VADSSGTTSSVPPEMLEHYASGYESQRLLQGSSQIELARTQELITRYALPPPAIVFDIGGGPGVYAFWLAKQGYEVHLIDATPRHIEQARQASLLQLDAPLAEIEVGDARDVKRADMSVDMALLLGPLYHLTERKDRLAALHDRAALRRQRVYDQPAHFLRSNQRFACLFQILRAEACLDDLFDGGLDDFGFLLESEGKAQHHGNRQNGGNGVGFALARDVGRGTVDGFVHAKEPVRGLARSQAGGWQHTHRTGQHGRFVCEDIAERVFGHDDIEAGWVPHQLHGAGIDQQVIDRHIGIIARDAFGNVSPQTRCVEDVRFIDRGDFPAPAPRQVEGGAHDAINFTFRIEHGIDGFQTLWRLTNLAGSAEIQAARQLAHDQ
jgi:SAM-dependent methyltransferase